MEMQPKLCSFLESPSVESRISTGEVLAILYEIAVQNVDDAFHFDNHHHLEIVLNNLAADSVKFRTKRDKRLQRMSFRQISDAIFEGRPLRVEIRFNKREKLEIDSCHRKLFYDQLCQLLQGDMNRHLTNNVMLRDLFGLGPTVDLNEPEDSQKQKAQKVDMVNFLLTVL
jgi:hypothetical protein